MTTMGVSTVTIAMHIEMGNVSTWRQATNDRDEWAVWIRLDQIACLGVGERPLGVVVYTYDDECNDCDSPSS